MYTFTTRQSRGKGPFFSTERGQRKRFWSDFLDEEDNHLGNVLVVISDKVKLYSHNKITLDSARAEVVSASDYYPGGLAMKGRTYSSSTYRYGFNGKEKDDSFSTATNYDYGFRIYNPEVSRFLSVDPLMRSFAHYSPYQFAGNRPIWALDLDGLEDEWYMNAWNKVKYGTGKTVETVNHMAESTASSVVLVGTSAIMPIINKGYTITQEGAHPGGPYNRKNKVDWAVPYSVKDWEFVRNDKLMEDYIPINEGKKIMNAAVDVIALAIPVKSPIKVEGKVAQRLIDVVASLVIKTPIKVATKKAINTTDNTSLKEDKKNNIKKE